jgi:hypothetical protein
MDDQGYVNVVGRIKDTVIRGGENISPREVEEFLYTHPAIRDVQVFGVPDERYGEELAAWVIVREGEELDAEAVRAFCDGQIARYKIPRYVRVVDAFPLTVTGKVQKFKMREREIEELGLRDAAAIETASCTRSSSSTRFARRSAAATRSAARSARRTRTSSSAPASPRSSSAPGSTRRSWTTSSAAACSSTASRA